MHSFQRILGAGGPALLARLVAPIAACCLVAGGALGAPPDAPSTGIRLARFASGFDQPLQLVAAPADSRLFVVEQPGRIRVIENGSPRREPFLDLTDRVGTNGNERGLLSLAFHPRYAENRYLYVDYTDRQGTTRVVRFTASKDGGTADPASAREILNQPQPYSNHNGGHVLFGPDSMLYVAFGDGGSGGDPENRAQNLGTRLGKILRIDVDHGDPFAIPPDNPFVSTRGALPEIWALGVRNPWRVAFDAPSGLFYVADVGQDRWEEVDVAWANRGGLNYGWRYFEGTHDFRRGRDEPRGLVTPVVEYDHGEGCSVTGGVVYRGAKIRELRGDYLYSDYCTGWIRSFRVLRGRAEERRQWAIESPGNVTSFGTDSTGEVYVVCRDGAIYRIEPARGDE